MSSIDVVIPCYNYARYLPQCVASVLGQEGVEVRALIIDDCSQDESEIVGRRLAEQDSRVEYRRHSINQGHIATYNEGLLEWANSDYVLLLSADDALSQGALSRAAYVLDQYPDVGLCYGQQIVFENEIPLTSEKNQDSSSFEIISNQEFLAAVYQSGSNPVPTPTAVVRTTLQKKIGGYKSELPHAGDLEMWLRCGANAAVTRLDRIQAFKREHQDNMAKDFTLTILPDLQQRRLAFESVIDQYAENIENPDDLLKKSNKSLAYQAFWGAHTLFEKGNIKLCNELLDFTLSLDPSFSSKMEWRKFKIKRKMGSQLWNLLDSMIKRLHLYKFG